MPAQPMGGGVVLDAGPPDPQSILFVFKSWAYSFCSEEAGGCGQPGLGRETLYVRDPPRELLCPISPVPGLARALLFLALIK